MTRARGLLLFLILTLLIASLVWTFRVDQQVTAERRAQAAREHELRQLEVALADLRASQAGYVAAGQGADYWFGRATEIGSVLSDALGRLAADTQSPEAQPHYARAQSLLVDLNRADGRARDYVELDQRLLASDVIFMDAFDLGTQLSSDVAAARDAELAASEARATALERQRLGATAGALGLAALGLILFSRPVREKQLPVSLADTLPDEPEEPADDPEPAGGADAPMPSPQPEPAGRVNLAGVAELCVDVGRLVDPRDLPPLLARAAHVLNARGLVLWVADETRASLRASLAHGYSDRVLARMGTLPIDGDNVTSIAFRTLRPQSVTGAADASGAIAVPLITSGGCVGVLAAEVRDPRPTDEALAVARLVAAQLAAVSAPPEAETARAVQG